MRKMDLDRLMTAWVDLDLAIRHITLYHSFQEQEEGVHWLRIAYLNAKAAYETSKEANPQLEEIIGFLYKASEKFTQVIFNLHGRLTEDMVNYYKPQLEEAKKELREVIEHTHEEPEV